MFVSEGFIDYGKVAVSIESAKEYYLNLGLDGERFSRVEPALRLASNGLSVPEPLVVYPPHIRQDNEGIDFSYVISLVNEVKRLPKLKGLSLFAAEINFLKPNSELEYHIDCRWHHVCTHRIHLPLLCDEAYFVTRGKRFRYEVGHIYELDNILPHKAINLSTETPKISVLMDFIDPLVLEVELSQKRNPRRRILYFNTSPNEDSYR